MNDKQILVTILSGTADTLEGKDVIQSDLNRLERFAHVNLIKFNKVRCKDLQLDQDNPKQIQVGWRMV